TLVVRELLGPDAEQIGRLELRRLLDQTRHQVAALDAHEAGHVEDRLLRVHRGDLAARLRERVDDGRGEAPEARVVGGVQPGRAGSHDGEVDVGHARSWIRVENLYCQPRRTVPA